MKTNFVSIHPCFSVAIATLVFFGLSAPTLHAQTFAGQVKLAESPTSFQALVYPVSTRQATIRVNIDNLTRGPVWIQVSDQHGRVYYHAVESTARYRGYLDLLLLPAGVYVVILSKNATVYTQRFSIEPPTKGRVVILGALTGPA